MKYYSKSPKELRQQFEEDKKNESDKKKRAYLIQIANFGILLVAIFLAVKTPFFKKEAKKSEQKLRESVQRTMKWKEWDISTHCLLGNFCTVNLIKKQENVSVDAFYLKITEQDSEKPLMKSFELIPKNLPVNQEKVFRIPFPEEYSQNNVELHFLNKSNEEVLMMQIYP